MLPIGASCQSSVISCQLSVVSRPLSAGENRFGKQCTAYADPDDVQLRFFQVWDWDRPARNRVGV
jgi:hypothetical protein